MVDCSLGVHVHTYLHTCTRINIKCSKFFYEKQTVLSGLNCVVLCCMAIRVSRSGLVYNVHVHVHV